MKLTMRAAAKKVTLITTAFVLAVSTLTAAVPFILSKNVSAESASVVTNDISTWYLGDSKIDGHQEVVANGLHVWTTGGSTNGSTRKAAGYRAVTPFALANAADAEITFTSYSGPRPSLQLGVDIDGDSDWDGYLVYEPWSYGDGYFWTSKNFGLPSGMGYEDFGTIAQFAAANPSAKVISIGYSLGTLGNHPDGDSVISKIKVNDTSYTFATLPPATPTNLRLNGDKLCGYATNVNYITPTWNAVAGAVSYNYTVTLPNGSVYGPVNVGNVTSVSGSFGAEGLSTFSVQAVNASGQTSAWATPCAVTYDATAPVVTGITQVYETAQNGRIGVTLTFSEPIDPASLGQGWYAVAGTGNTQFIKRYYSTSNQTVSFKDVVGNQGTYSFTVDMSTPTGTLSYSPSTLTKNSVIVTLKTNEPIKQSSLPGTWLKKSDTEYQKSYPVNTTQEVTLEDLTGNKTSVTVFISWIDKTPPTVTLKSSPATVGTNPYKTVSYSLYDANKIDKAEVNGHEIPLTDNYWSDLNNVGVGSMFGVAGTNTIKVWDVAGNVTEFTVVLDNVAPTATYTFSNNNGAALTKENVTVTLTTNEPIQTPTDWTRVDATHFTRVYANNGKNTLTIADLAGNTATSTFEVKRIDRNAPTVAGVASGNTVKGPVNLTFFDPKYEGYDGFDALQGVKVNGNPVATIYNNANKTYALSLQDEGAYTVVATDKAGNPTTLQFSIDNTAPAVVITNPTSLTLGNRNSVLVDATIDDAVSYEVLLNGATVESGNAPFSGYVVDTSAANGTYTVQVKAYDQSGNEGSSQITFTVDNDGPSLVTSLVNGATVGESLTIESEVGDGDEDTFGLAIFSVDDVTTPLLTSGSLAYSFNTRSLANGNYIAKLSVEDGFGNPTVKSISFTIFNAPVVVVTQDPNAAPGNDGGDNTPANLPSAVGPAGNVAAVLGLGNTNTGDDTTGGTEGVEGTSTEKNLAAAVDTDSTDGTVLGMAWYWWLLILAALATLIWWIIASIRNRAAQN